MIEDKDSGNGDKDILTNYPKLYSRLDTGQSLKSRRPKWEGHLLRSGPNASLIWKETSNPRHR